MWWENVPFRLGAKMTKVEILEFNIPDGESHLYLPEVQLDLPLPEAHIRLTNIFSPFGLLYQVQ